MKKKKKKKKKKSSHGGPQRLLPNKRPIASFAGVGTGSQCLIVKTTLRLVCPGCTAPA
jgi:hypothetical protein